MNEKDNLRPINDIEEEMIRNSISKITELSQIKTYQLCVLFKNQDSKFNFPSIYLVPNELVELSNLFHIELLDNIIVYKFKIVVEISIIEHRDKSQGINFPRTYLIIFLIFSLKNDIYKLYTEAINMLILSCGLEQSKNY